MLFFADYTIEDAFHTLREQEDTPKAGKERTSGLFFFLAFDMLQRLRDGEKIVPMSPNGEARKQMAQCYSELVAIPANGEEWMVMNLGEIDYTGTRTPEKKINGDFFTTPLKRASQMLDGMDYPGRPLGRPLLCLGKSVGGECWGIGKHLEWADNLPYYLMNRCSAFPWTALAVFVLREHEWGDSAKKDSEDFGGALRGKFTEELCAFWEQRMRHESRKFADFGGADFQQKRPMPWGAQQPTKRKAT